MAAGPQGVKRAPTIRPAFNIFSLLDHLTGRYYRGKDNLWYLNGGFHQLMGWAGRGNSYKTAITKACALRVCARYKPEFYEIFDTENSFQYGRLKDFLRLVPEGQHLDVEKLLDSGDWNITDQTMEYGDEWWKKYRTEAADVRTAIKEKDMRVTPFKEVSGEYRKIMNPWILDVDSFTELKVKVVERMHDKAEVGASELNTEAMKGGAAKSQMMGQLPLVAAQGGYYMNLIAHAGDEIKMDMYAPSHKKLAGLKGDIKLKGVPEKFSFLTNNCFIATSTAALLDKGTKLPMFPTPDKPETMGDTDLQIVRFEQLRGKSGPTGAFLDLIFSQKEGLLVGITEFFYLKEICGCYGMEVKGNNQGFRLALCPDVFFTRKSIRTELNTNPKFARAMSITAALAYMEYNWFDMDPSLRCKPEELYTDLTAKGYDWNEILTDTVEWWYFQDQAAEIGKPTITAMTLLDMRRGELVPTCLKSRPK